MNFVLKTRFIKCHIFYMLTGDSSEGKEGRKSRNVADKWHTCGTSSKLCITRVSIISTDLLIYEALMGHQKSIKDLAAIIWQAVDYQAGTSCWNNIPLTVQQPSHTETTWSQHWTPTLPKTITKITAHKRHNIIMSTASGLRANTKHVHGQTSTPVA